MNNHKAVPNTATCFPMLVEYQLAEWLAAPAVLRWSLCLGLSRAMNNPGVPAEKRGAIVGVSCEFN